jgi:zinc transport system substrate-binding protein
MFLDKPLRSLARKARVVPLASAPGITTRPARKGGLWESDGQDHDHDHADHDHSHDSIDAHIWLDPANAKAMVAEIARVLAEVDPANAARYAENGVTVAGRIDELDEELSAMLAPVRARPFIVFHDAYQYFEQRYQLKAAGSITVSADRPPGAKRVAAIKAKVREQGAICVFAEPQFEPKLVDMMITGTPARSATLDPEGSALPAGADAYFVLMRTLGANLARCLQP